MGKPTEPNPVKLFIGLLIGNPDILPEVGDKLEDRFGRRDCESPVIPFDYTDYYNQQMGPEIKRKFISFEKLIDPGELASIKIWTNEVEELFSNRSDQELPRPINIDPGYVGLSKLVLATTKNYSHRLYLGSGIYGEVTLQYRSGEYKPQPWTYPDYKSEEYLEFFARVRKKYCRQLE